MEAFEKIYIDGVFVIVVNCTRSTMLEANEFKKLIKDEINSGHNKLVIDLTKCEYVDSTFFGAIMMTFGMMTDKGYMLKVVRPTISGEDIFTSTNTLRLFDIYKIREEAIKSFDGKFQSD
ncbi:MAG: STAS domain-containing protein [Ignavibacteriaceae bacterium]